MTQQRDGQTSQVDRHADDSDLKKGALEGGPDGHSNANAEGALGEDGLPRDEVAIAEDVLGANEDQSQG